jgi:hypothetical protein
MGAIPGAPPGDEARTMLRRLAVVAAGTNDPDALRVLAEAMGAVPGALDRSILIDVAKYPNCVGEFQTAVLKLLERESQSGPFDGDLWKMVDWAERQVPRLDLHGGPKRTSGR